MEDILQNLFHDGAHTHCCCSLQVFMYLFLLSNGYFCLYLLLVMYSHYVQIVRPKYIHTRRRLAIIVWLVSDSILHFSFSLNILSAAVLSNA